MYVHVMIHTFSKCIGQYKEVDRTLTMFFQMLKLIKNNIIPLCKKIMNQPLRQNNKEGKVQFGC